MLYNAYELNRALLSSASAWASVGAELLNNPTMPMGYFGLGPVMASALDVFAHAAAPRGKPLFDIETVTTGGKDHPVTEAIVLHRPFGNLLRFSHPGLPADAPRLLIVAPMSCGASEFAKACDFGKAGELAKRCDQGVHASSLASAALNSV